MINSTPNSLTITPHMDWQGNALTREYSEVVQYVKRTCKIVTIENSNMVQAQYVSQNALTNAADFIAQCQCRVDVTIRYN